MIRNLLAFAGFLAIVAVSAVAIQASGWRPFGGAPPRLLVSFVGLDLSRPEGVAMLDRRIDQAIDRICGKVPEQALAQAAEVRRCRRAARLSTDDQVAEAIDRAQLERRYAAERAAQLAQSDDRSYAEPAYPQPAYGEANGQRVVFAPRREIYALPANYRERPSYRPVRWRPHRAHGWCPRHKRRHR